jgi:hypothetical protein
MLSALKKRQITWDQYATAFENLMKERNLREHIVKNYMTDKSICLLCSEPAPKQCHRSLVAAMFADIITGINIINL